MFESIVDALSLLLEVLGSYKYIDINRSHYHRRV